MRPWNHDSLRSFSAGTGSLSKFQLRRSDVLAMNAAPGSRAEAFDQVDNADAGAEPLLRMRPRAHDHIDQHRRVGADQRSLAANAFRGSSRDSAGANSACGRRRWSADAGAALRRWLATRLPRWKISTVATVIRASTSWRISWCGTL